MRFIFWWHGPLKEPTSVFAWSLLEWIKLKVSFASKDEHAVFVLSPLNPYLNVLMTSTTAYAGCGGMGGAYWICRDMQANTPIVSRNFMWYLLLLTNPCNWALSFENDQQQGWRIGTSMQGYHEKQDLVEFFVVSISHSWRL